MTVVGAGATCVRWGYPGLLAIVASWFASPVLAGLLSAVMLVCIKKGVLEVRPVHYESVHGMSFLHPREAVCRSTFVLGCPVIVEHPGQGSPTMWEKDRCP